MKLASFQLAGRSGFGIVSDDEQQISDLSGRWGSLKTAISSASLDEMRSATAGAPTLALSEVQIAIPVPDAERFVCAGLNFRAHVAESGAQATAAFPSLFLRSPSTFSAPNEPILRPFWSDAYDYECEFAVVIGRGGRHIRSEDAMGHIFGYTLLMDGSVRDVQFDHSLCAGKNFFRSGSVGPWIVTADQVGDPTKLQLIGRVNGEVRQSAPISDLIFDIPTLISYWSKVDALSAGDILSVGTPAGVGFAMNPKQFLEVDDIVETEVAGIGILRNRVIADQSPN